MPPAKPILVVRCPGRKPVRAGPGGRIRIGRHASNDLVLADDTVSRFHAVIAWDPDEDRPHVVDNESANGVEVDGEMIEVQSHLNGGNQVTIGKFTLVVEVITLAELSRRESGVNDVLVPALNDSDSVVLYTEKKDQLAGRASTPAELHRVLLDLESTERTGTLQLRGSVLTKITFCQGLVMTATHGDLVGRDALQEIMHIKSVIYGFTRELRPVDDPLNVSIKNYLETELSEMTKKVVIRRDSGRLMANDDDEPPTQELERRSR
jgi:pSer/pThr/pTyr-binding forkhead associated (FHA) protein